MQKPDATLIAGYTAWQRNFDRHVMKGEKGIKILAPAPVSYTHLDVYKRQESGSGRNTVRRCGARVQAG